AGDGWDLVERIIRGKWHRKNKLPEVFSKHVRGGEQASDGAGCGHWVGSGIDVERRESAEHGVSQSHRHPSSQTEGHISLYSLVGGGPPWAAAGPLAGGDGAGRGAGSGPGGPPHKP